MIILGLILGAIGFYMLGHYVSTQQHLKDKVYRKYPPYDIQKNIR